MVLFASLRNGKKTKERSDAHNSISFSCSYERVIFNYLKAFYLFSELRVGRTLEAEHIKLNLVLQRQSRRVLRR